MRGLTQVLATTWDDALTREYVSPGQLAHMHKIVLRTPPGVSLSELSSRLQEARDASDDVPKHYLWVEQPENVPTCLAVAPNRKPDALTQVLKSCSLLRS